MSSFLCYILLIIGYLLNYGEVYVTMDDLADYLFYL